MILAKKIRLYPTAEQEYKLWQSVGTARFIYNWALNKQEENYKNGGKFIKDNDLRKEITQLKKDELPWLNEVSNNVAKQAVKDCCNAYKNFFKGLVDKPKFRTLFYKGKDYLKTENLKEEKDRYQAALDSTQGKKVGDALESLYAPEDIPRAGASVRATKIRAAMQNAINSGVYKPE